MAAVPAVVVPAFDWSDLNPLTFLVNAASATVTTGWQNFMTSVWAAGLWLTGLAFRLVDAFTTPDLSEGGVMGKLYPVTFGIGAGLALILAFLQVGFAAFQRDGRALGRLLVGLWQFMLAWGGMIGVGAALNLAVAGLTEGLLQVALGAPSFAELNIFEPLQLRQAVDAVAATILGVCGFFLVLAAIGYLLVMLVRAAALMILLATSPICAAGLLSEGTRAWFWKSLRWFLSALLIAPLSALVLGIGKLLTDGVLSGAGQSTEAAVGAAFLGTVLVLVGAFCPLFVFRLLAFVDPGTSSGASFRSSLDAAGGVGGLLGASTSAAEGGGDSGAATSQAPGGSSQGEADAAAATQARFAASMGGVGMAANRVTGAAVAAAAFSADVLGAAGVGHPQPYFDGSSRRPPAQQSGGNTPGGSPPGSDSDPAPPPGPDPDLPPAPLPPPPLPPPPSPGPPAGGNPRSGGGKPAGGTNTGTGGGAAGEAGGAEAAAAAAL